MTWNRLYRSPRLGHARVVRRLDRAAERARVAEPGVVDQHQQHVRRPVRRLGMADQVPVRNASHRRVRFAVPLKAGCCSGRDLRSGSGICASDVHRSSTSHCVAGTACDASPGRGNLRHPWAGADPASFPRHRSGFTPRARDGPVAAGRWGRGCGDTARLVQPRAGSERDSASALLTPCGGSAIPRPRGRWTDGLGKPMVGPTRKGVHRGDRTCAAGGAGFQASGLPRRDHRGARTSSEE